jgi:hypothetical protein
MRRLLSIAAAGVLALALAAPAMAGANTSNTSGSAKVANGEWYTESGSGYAYFVLDSSYGSYGEFYEESGEYIACDDSGESYGFAGNRTYGWASDVAIDLDSRLNHGSVTGTLELFSETVNECTGDYGVDKEDATSVAFSASLDGTGSVARFRDHGSFKVPGDYNSHSKQSGKQREATGSIELDGIGSRQFDWAILADVSWSDHSNG